MTILAEDTFIRADSSGSWGTASDGQIWAKIDGAGTPSIVSNRGEILAFASQDTTMQLGSSTTAGINFLVRVNILGGNGGPVWRIQDADHFYRLVVEDDGIAFLQWKNGAFNFTIITTANIPNWDRLQEWWVRVIHTVGNDVEVRVWLDGSSEPSTPLISINDTNITSAGGYGLISVGYDNGNPFTNYFDNLTVTDGVFVLEVNDVSSATDVTASSMVSNQDDSASTSESNAGRHATSLSDSATTSESISVAFQFLAQGQNSAAETRTFSTILSRSDSATATDEVDFNPPVTNVPTLVLAARCRDGIIAGKCRDGRLKARSRDGILRGRAA